MRQLDTRLTIDRDVAKAPNLVDRLQGDDAKTIGNWVYEGFTRDKATRFKWEERNGAAMDLAMQVAEAKTFPWAGCANVIFPLVTIAALQFSAQAYPALIQGPDVIRYRVVNPDKDGQLVKRAQRIATHMSWQVLEEDEAWEEQHDRLLIHLAIVGSAFMKSFYSPSQFHNVSELVMSRDLVIDYYAKSTETAARLSHLVPLYRNEIYSRSMDGIFVEDTVDKAWYKNAPTQVISYDRQKIEADKRAGRVPPPADEDGAFQTIEQHRWLDLDGDGYAEPYIATIEESSRDLLRLVARWEGEEYVQRRLDKRIVRIKPTNYFTKFSFIPSPDGGIYDLGFGTFLGPINEAVSTGINQLLDMGTMQNSIGGFLGRGAKIRGGIYTMAPWEWKRVDSTGDDLRKSLVPYPDRQPLDVTLKMIVLLIEYANRIAGTTDTQVGENPGQNTPAETSRTTHETGMRMFTMIFARVWRSLRQEYRKLYTLNSMFLQTSGVFGQHNLPISREDYTGDSSHIAPVANPAMTSTTMQVNQAVTLKQAAAGTAGYNRDVVERIFLKAIRIDNIDEVFPGMEVTGPLPNYRLQLEEIKERIANAKISAHEKEWANALLAERPKMMAEVDKLKAEAAALIAGIGAEKAGMQIKAFEVIIGAMQDRIESDDNRLGMLLKGSGGEDGKGNDRGGVPRLAGPAGNSSVQTPPQGNGQVPSGTVG